MQEGQYGSFSCFPAFLIAFDSCFIGYEKDKLPVSASCVIQHFTAIQKGIFRLRQFAVTVGRLQTQGAAFVQSPQALMERRH